MKMGIKKDSVIPLYHQLKEIIKRMIEIDEMEPGEMIPSERELCKKYNLSRMTVNKAISGLVDDGLVYREQGKGTFVSKPKEFNQKLHLKGFSEDIKKKGLKSETKILDFRVEKLTKEMRKTIIMPEEVKKVIVIKRLRIIEEEPFAIETAWLPFKFCSKITREKLEGNSLYEILKREYNYIPEYAKQSIKPIKINTGQSKLLEIEEGELALLFNRTTYLENGEQIEYTETINKTDKYKYEVILK